MKKSKMEYLIVRPPFEMASKSQRKKQREPKKIKRACFGKLKTLLKGAKNRGNKKTEK